MTQYNSILVRTASFPNWVCCLWILKNKLVKDNFLTEGIIRECITLEAMEGNVGVV